MLSNWQRSWRPSPRSQLAQATGSSSSWSLRGLVDPSGCCRYHNDTMRRCATVTKLIFNLTASGCGRGGVWLVSAWLPSWVCVDDNETIDNNIFCCPISTGIVAQIRAHRVSFCSGAKHSQVNRMWMRMWGRLPLGLLVRGSHPFSGRCGGPFGRWLSENLNHGETNSSNTSDAVAALTNCSAK